MFRNSQTSSSSSQGSGEGRGRSNFDENVHQDISSLAARTHAEKTENVDHYGRRRAMTQTESEATNVMEKAAQGGRGFQTYGLDLGVLGGRNNVDEELKSESSGRMSGGASSGFESQSRSSSSGRVSGGSSSGYESSRGSQRGSSSSYSTQYSNQGSGKYDQQMDFSNDDDYEDDYVEEQTDNSQHGGSQGSHSSSYQYSSQSSTNRGEPKFRHYQRRKRDASFDSGKPLCESAQCVNVKCVVGPLDKNTGALIALRTRLVAQTLNKVRREHLF
jgi:hypothetical protein